MSSHTATVEALTAEVRVLKVGSRQVTMSVFNQLDFADLDDVEVFGRVRTRDEISGSVNLVGMHMTTGCLVRTGASRPDWTADEGPESFYHWIFHTYYSKTKPDSFVVAESNSRRLLWKSKSIVSTGCPNWTDFRGKYPNIVWANLNQSERTVYDWLRAENDYVNHSGAHCNLKDLRIDWQEIADLELKLVLEAQSVYENALSKPLIVLAGLR